MTTQNEFATALQHHQTGALDQAEAGYRSVLAASPDHAGALHYLGLLAYQRGMPDEAASLLHRSLEISPDDAETHEHFGLVLVALGDPEAAEEHLRQALRLDPNAMGAPQNLTLVLMEQARWFEARELAQQVLAASPDDPGALNNLGLCQLHTGLRTAAAATFRHALELHPGLIEGYAGLAEAEVLKPSDPLLLQLDMLALAEMPAHMRTLCHFTLGRMHRDAGNHERSFEHYTSGNQLRAEAIEPFDIGAHIQQVDAMISAFDASFFATKPPAVETDLPVFVVGMPRSGTTLVEQIMCAHPDVHGAQELPWIGAIADELMRTDADPDTTDALAHQYLDALSALAPEASRVVDKMPHNYAALWAISILFKGATVLHVRRDPRDIALSCYAQNFRQPHPWKHDLTVLGQYIRQYQRLMDHWMAVAPVRIVDVVYEDLVREPEQGARMLIEAIGLPWDDAVSAWHTQQRPVRTPSALDVTRPASTSSIDRWKDYEPWLGPLFKALIG